MPHAHFSLALAGALPLAWAIDACFGEPRDAWHPVAWLGRAFAPVGQRLRGLRPAPAFVGGALAWTLGATLIAVAAGALQRMLSTGPLWLGAGLLALLLKPTFAWRMLRDEARAVEAAQAHGLEAARSRLARLVSRDTRVLDADQIRETTIETVAENLNDALIAPLFWYALFGLPGAAVYRFANTLDAMWGYRGAWEWAGKWAARADDALSWFPARITALLLRPTFSIAAWCSLREEAGRTPSPNGGWPMGAIALLLGVRLRKPGMYALNATAPSPVPAQLEAAIRRCALAAHLSVVIVTLSWLIRALIA